MPEARCRDGGEGEQGDVEGCVADYVEVIVLPGVKQDTVQRGLGTV